MRDGVLRPALDDDVLQAAISRWQFGDWPSLCRLDEEVLGEHQDKAALVLLCAVSCFQTGELEKGKRLLRLARQAGVSRQTIGAMLASGIENTLGRAAALLGGPARSKAHFENAIRLAPVAGDMRLLSQARQREQLTQLAAQFGLPAASFEQPAASAVAQVPALRAEHTAVLELGPAWSGNTVNTVIFRHHGVVTWGEHQYTAFYADSRHIRIVRRHLATNALETRDLQGEYNVRDAHNCISLGVDRAGCIHMSYDHHATRLRYRRSLKPESIAEWSDELLMTGVSEEKVTYPTFILPHDGYPLALLYRDGTQNKGSARIKTYDEETQSWADRPVPVLSGSDQKPWTSNAYWNHPAIGSDGTLHLSFVWRTGILGESQLVNNINIGHAWSPDNGLTWFTSRGLPYKLPITQVTAEVVWATPPGSNLINQTSMALDSANRPHIMFYANDARGIPQYQRIWFDGHTWQQQTVTQRDVTFNLTGRGTLRIPISRPEVVIDAQDRVYAIGRGDFSRDRLVAMRLDGASDGEAASQLLWPEPLGFAEPVLDRTRWVRDKILTFFVLRTDQPNGDRCGDATTTDTARLVDIELQGMDE